MYVFVMIPCCGWEEPGRSLIVGDVDVEIEIGGERVREGKGREGKKKRGPG